MAKNLSTRSKRRRSWPRPISNRLPLFRTRRQNPRRGRLANIASRSGTYSRNLQRWGSWQCSQWGLAMGMQSAEVRRLQLDGVFTTAATATVIFLVGDLVNWRATVAERRRLTGVLLSLFVGATAGGLLLVHAQIYAPVLPFVITVAVVVTAAIVLREHGATAELRPKSRSKVVRIF